MPRKQYWKGTLLFTGNYTFFEMGLYCMFGLFFMIIVLKTKKVKDVYDKQG